MSYDEAFLVELLRALRVAKLEAVIVGTTAAILQGVPLMTEDVDLLIRDTPKNREKLATLCAELGRGRPVQITPLSPTVRLIGADDIDVDVLFDTLSGDLSFASVRARSVQIAVGETTAAAASLEDVIRSKQAANRPKDRAQLPMLESFLRVKNALDE